MGLFDRFASGKPQSNEPGQPGGEKPAVVGGVMSRLAEARVKLAARDLPGALAIHEEVLATAGNRPDVLVTISGDLGVHGHVNELIEFIAQRYDAARHGPATGINLLQAYLAVRNVEAAQHLLDILFDLNRPELEDRLFGFSNAIGELMAGHEHVAPTAEQIAGDAPVENKVSLASISKPIWFYQIEELAPQLVARKEGKLRKVAFAQCATLGVADTVERSRQPEDELGRFCRGVPLWFTETFAAAAGYEAVTAVAVSSARHHVLFPAEWTAQNIRELNDTTKGGLDYVITSAVRNVNDDFEFVLRIWEVKKFRELKQFTTRWTPSTADTVLKQFQEQVRLYMEWTALPAGLPYTAPAAPQAHIQALGATLSQFFVEKGVLAPDHATPGADLQLSNAKANPADARAQLMLVSTLLRAKAMGLPLDPAALDHAKAWLASDAGQQADASALLIKLA
jgi:hypothetical protein